MLAVALARHCKVNPRQTAWYVKAQPTFSDALAALRYQLWQLPTFHVSHFNQLIAKLPAAVFNRFADALCYSTKWPKSSLANRNVGADLNRRCRQVQVFLGIGQIFPITR